MVRGAALLLTAAAAAGALVAVASPARADPLPAGHDVSYPQCGRTLPQRPEIAVVGVNAGTGTTTNPCLADQLAWGDRAADGSRLPADVYVNTANPGHLAAWWPRSDLTRDGLPVANPAGTCRGAEDPACGYVYGWSVAVDDLLDRGVPDASARTWWLDVETMNTWSWSRDANLAVLEGMADALHSAGADVGVYSTPRQWASIAGRAGTGSALAGSPSWVAGAASRQEALALCSATPFSVGGRVAMVQWVEDGIDHDLACAPSIGSGTRTSRGAGASTVRLLLGG